MHRRLIALGLALASGYAAAQGLPSGVLLFDPGKTRWNRAAPPGAQWVPIYGHSAQPGPYLYAQKSPPGTVTLPQTYPDQRSYTVISGTWHMGFGAQAQDAQLIALPPGSHVVVPAGVPVFTATRKDPVVVHIGGTGPSRRTIVN